MEEYPYLWSRIISKWHTPGDDRAWLMYTANYLFRSGEARWAIDPLRLCQRIPEAPRMDIARDLAPLSFVLLTHRHADHLDLDLVHALKANPILWIIPAYLLEAVQSTGIGREKIIVPQPMQPIHIHGVAITPFESLHWEDDPAFPDGRRGVPSTGYLLEFNGKRWLFPGDIRTYDANLLPAFGRVDGLFAHLWLGRGQALREEPSLLDAFCRFHLAFEPKRIVLAHLEEYGRDAEDFWGAEHVPKVIQYLNELDPKVCAYPAYMGNQIKLCDELG